MNNTLDTIPILNLLISFVPVLVVLVIIWRWQRDIKVSLWALFRMVIQLVLIGYVLTFIFNTDHSWVILVVLSVMLVSSSWISLRTLSDHRKELYFKALIAIFIGGGFTLILITQGVLNLKPWYTPKYVIPLAGMIFANAMNSISLSGERIKAELSKGSSYNESRIIALRSGLIPITNSLFAVGLVSLPGMMTGQILSGVDPLIAVRYQIMVMCMAYGSAGISCAIFLVLIKNTLK